MAVESGVLVANVLASPFAMVFWAVYYGLLAPIGDNAVFTSNMISSAIGIVLWAAVGGKIRDG